MLEAGLGDLLAAEPDLLAIAASSHSGEPAHVAAVARLLERAGLQGTDLDNTPGWPLDDTAARELLRAGGGPDRPHQNCSGKHAAMLATCVVAGWPTAGYLASAHPLQLALRASVARISGEPVEVVGVDGCGAPLFAISLTGLARAYARLVTAEPGSSARLVADAMRAHPFLVGGTGRAVTELMAAVGGCLAKDGAEGVFAAALADGSTVAVKIDDGAARAAVPLAVAGLRRLGVSGEPIERLATTGVYGHGRLVGEVRVTVRLG